MNVPALFLSSVVCTCLLSFPASAELVNVAREGVAYASGPLWEDAKPSDLLDGDKSRPVHESGNPPDPFYYTIDLGRSFAVKLFSFYPRQDGCCPERVRDFRVSLHQDKEGGIGAEVWGMDLMTGTEDSLVGAAGKRLDVVVPEGKVGRWIRILAMDDPSPHYSLQLTEVEAYADRPPSEVNRSLNASVSTELPVGAGLNPGAIVDGNRSTYAHSDATTAEGFSYLINLGAKVRLSRIRIWPRQDECCPGGLTRYRVSVHPNTVGGAGEAVWSADLHLDGSNPGHGAGGFDELLSTADVRGTFQGQYIKIQSLSSAPADRVLQISEVQAFGEVIGDSSIVLVRQPQRSVVGVGSSARFEVGAVVSGGRPGLLAYQWRREGVDIPGANSAAYQTPAVLAADDKAVFSCVVAYPGLPSTVTDDAVLRVHLAHQARAFTNRRLGAGTDIQQIVNNDRSDVVHGDEHIEPGFAYQVDLELPVEVEEITIYPRPDGCCPDRLKRIRVSLHGDRNGRIGDVLWSVDLINEERGLAGEPSQSLRLTADLDPEGTFEGQWIQILNLDDPVPAYSLEMSEVEVLGRYVSPEPLLRFLSEPEDYQTVPGRSALFTATAKVVNGNPRLIGYQWLRNGELIRGATKSSYRTPPLTTLEVAAEYQCVVSYPGHEPVRSRVVRAGFDFNYAKGQPAFSNHPVWGVAPGDWSISQLVDGDRGNTIHGGEVIEPGLAYWVNLGVDVAVDHVAIYPRQDGCCPDRLADFEVSLHEDDHGELGRTNWFADLLRSPGSDAGGVVVLRARDGSGEFRGTWLRILSLADPVPPFALQMNEIEVFGTHRPRIKHLWTGGSLELRWTEGILEAASQPVGPWVMVATATSPWLAPANLAQQYFRLRR